MWQKLILLKSFLWPTRGALILDLGAAQTKVAINNRKIVHLPTLAAALNREEVLSFGQKASRYLNDDSKIQTLSPVKFGQVADEELLTLFLKQLRHDLKLSPKWWHRSPQVYVLIDENLSIIHRQAYQNCLHKAGFAEVTFLSRAKALAASAVKRYQFKSNLMCLDLGHLLSTVVFVDAKHTLTRSVRLGGFHLNRLIQSEIRRLYQVDVSLIEIEKIKAEIVTLEVNAKPMKLVVRGKNLKTFLPDTVEVNSADLLPGLQPLFMRVVEEINFIFSHLNPEQTATILTQGIFVTGGGSQIRGLSDFIQTHCALTTKISKTPADDALLGAIVLIETAETL